MRDNPLYDDYAVGRYSYGHPIVLDWRTGVPLTIGAFCSFANGSTIILDGNHRPDWASTYPFHAYFPGGADALDQTNGSGPVVIGNDVWVGYQALILPGVTVGDGAVIGARAVVSRDVPPYALAVGNPARIARSRFAPESIAGLLRIKWWDWPEERIREALPLLLSDRVEELLLAA
jgi:acetyltransferase-like isoleucine patch superfamily enzyme